MKSSLLKKSAFLLAAVLCAASLMVTPAVEVDAQGFKLEEVVVACGYQGQCYQTVCQLSTVQDCGGFTQCPC